MFIDAAIECLFGDIPVKNMDINIKGNNLFLDQCRYNHVVEIAHC